MFVFMSYITCVQNPLHSLGHIACCAQIYLERLEMLQRSNFLVIFLINYFLNYVAGDCLMVTSHCMLIDYQQMLCSRIIFWFQMLLIHHSIWTIACDKTFKLALNKPARNLIICPKAPNCCFAVDLFHTNLLSNVKLPSIESKLGGEGEREMER